MGPASEYIGNEVRQMSTASRVAPGTIAKEKAAIHHELELLHSAVDGAHRLISDIEQRVMPVSMARPTPDAAPAHEAVGASDVYAQIHSATSGLHYLQDRMAAVLGNLEV